MSTGDLLALLLAGRRGEGEDIDEPCRHLGGEDCVHRGGDQQLGVELALRLRYSPLLDMAGS
jgi:hypothetical protein